MHMEAFQPLHEKESLQDYKYLNESLPSLHEVFQVERSKESPTTPLGHYLYLILFSLSQNQQSWTLPHLKKEYYLALHPDE